jgi:glutathionyl-hydroquinone reductase
MLGIRLAPQTVKQWKRFRSIKRGYYSIPFLNPTGIVPLGPDLPYFR